MKKTLLTLIFFILISGYQLLSQCVADAGPDRVVCNENNGLVPLQIGGNPTAVSGTPPFTYTWEGRQVLTIGNLTFVTTASEILNDTTLANPTVVNNDLFNNFRLILTVTDANNNICKDTMDIYYSIFGINMSIFMFTINQGDSILLNWGSNVDGGMPPLQYLWRPNHGLRDSTHLNFWAKPQHTIKYFVTVTDTAGCTFEGPDYYVVSVNPVSTNETISTNDYMSVFPNPASEKINFQLTNLAQGKHVLSVYNTSGALVSSQPFLENMLVVDVKNLNSGFYSYQLSSEKGVALHGTFVVE